MHEKYIKLLNYKHLNISEYNFYYEIEMSFYAFLDL